GPGRQPVRGPRRAVVAGAEETGGGSRPDPAAGRRVEGASPPPPGHLLPLGAEAPSVLGGGLPAVPGGALPSTAARRGAERAAPLGVAADAQRVGGLAAQALPGAPPAAGLLPDVPNRVVDAEDEPLEPAVLVRLDPRRAEEGDAGRCAEARPA